MSTIKSMHTNLVYILSILFLVFGIMGYLDIKNNVYSGYSTDGDFTITRVEDGSPAQAAGLQVGDQLVMIDSMDVRDTKAWSNEPRTQIGQTKEYVVNRNGEDVSTSLTFAAQTSQSSMLNRLGWTMGLIFLLMGLWAFRSRGDWASFLFAMFALGFANSFMGGPHIENGFLDDLVDTVQFSFVLLAFAFLVDFLLHYPKRSSSVDSPSHNKKIYGPAIFLVLFFLALTILKVDATSGLNVFIRYAIFLFVVVYFGRAILIMVNNYRNASAEEKSGGMSLMFWGTVIGLLPILIVFAMGTLMPTMSIPGEDYAFITMALIPITFAMALNKK